MIIDCVTRETYTRLFSKHLKVNDENIALLNECERLNEKLDKIETLYKSLIAEIGGISNGR